MSWFQSFVLGVVQGITEFLPISSSAHLLLVPWFFGWKDPGLAFDVFLHLGTLTAIFFYFAQDFWQLFKAGIASIIERKIGFERERLLFWLIVVGSIPAGLAGLLLHDVIEANLRAPLLVAVSLSSLGFLLYWVDGKYPALRSVDDLSMKDAIWIGLAQAFALIPGVSRSGSTMMMGRALGLTREAAARYSFLLAFPITLAAAVFKCRDLFEGGQLTLPVGYLVTGFLGSLIFGLLSIHFLLAYLRSADFGVFAWYRIALAAVIVICSLVFGM